MRRTLGCVVLGLLVSLAGAGCGVGLPDEGPVEEAQTSGSGSRADAMAINPLGPQPGQSRSDVVKGFLDAMRATPIRDDVARQFLAERSRSTWEPDETIVYDTASLPRPSAQAGDLVEVTLTGADRIDDRGSWQGAVTEDAAAPDDVLGPDLRFTVIDEDGQFRIDSPPDALIVPQDWYAQRFRQVSLFFFDPTSQVLVPDPVFVPRAADLASTLVRRLIAGPAPELEGRARNLIPAGADPALSVPVSGDGLATVDLEGEVSMPGLVDRGLLVAQLAWTLRQDPSVERLSVRIDGESVIPAGQEEVGVTTGEPFAPFVADANKLLYGLAEGVMVAGPAQDMASVSGPFGQTDLGLRSITPDLYAAQAAGVTSDGSAVYVGPVRVAAGAEEATPVVTGASDLLVPAWDFADRLWMVDRRADGAVVSYLREGQIEEIVIEGVTDQDVKSFLVSRDGSRFVAVLRGANEDVIVVSRLLQDADGKVVGSLPARQVDVEGGRGLKIRDIAWLSPTSIVVLHPIDPTLFLVRSASVDGAPGGVDDLSLTLDERVVGLAGTPDPSLSTYAISRVEGEVRLVDLSGPTGGDIEVAPGITSLGYVG
ncbi:LpqB family beta-propeller domain-containing protein [Nocardioides sp.]|uniref:LpqB family beta-propeller domain-containing protein n=1 Tax=Nocardioides sp. TaxID=35761 RepID=UPI001A35756D|nr:LpqB family beta-propeller domain-containing protein [Nocardioides sp.]MBJ7359483.1 GerMN domain-containing protein [Nocardioides sp.]